MLSDIRCILVRCFYYHKPRSKAIVQFSQRNFSKQQHKYRPIENYKTFIRNFNSKVITLSELLTKQFNAVATQRSRRTFQIVAAYRRMYGDSSLKRALSEIGRTMLRQCGGRRLFFVFAATVFKWEDERISDSELTGLVEDMLEIQHIEEDSKHPVDVKGYLKSWQQVIDKDHLKVWRKPLKDTHLYEYKVYGTFYDVTPKCFSDIQVDLEYRKEWDNRVIKLEIIDTDDETGTEIVQWITHFPYPMYSREYIYKRRYQIDEKKNIMVLSSHAVVHPKCPVDDNHVRVHMYSSTMVIKPHKGFDDNGFDYVMTYYDDPQTTYSSFCYNWLANSAVPRFVDELHMAAKNLGTKRMKGTKSTKNNIVSTTSEESKRQYC